MNRNRKLSIARAFMHDLLCMSTHCQGDNDHARRTQHTFARAAVAAEGREELGYVVHDAACPAGRGCTWRIAHIARIGQHADRLADAMTGQQERTS